MKLVFDTNIFISALVFPHGLAEKAVMKIINGEDHLIISKAILDEVLSVLAGKFNRDREALSHTAVYLDEISQRVHPRRPEAIVTGDKARLKFKEYKGVRIISLREYLSASSPAPDRPDK